MADANLCISVDLDMPSLVPHAVQYTVFDKDPVPGYITQIKKSQNFYRQQLENAADEPGKEQLRTVQTNVAWDRGFKVVTGDNLWLATKRTATSSNILSSNAPDGRKWIATKTTLIKERPVCWCIPVDVKTGEQVDISFNEGNMFDFRTLYDNTMSEPADSGNEEESK